jgi:hypothetical protein
VVTKIGLPRRFRIDERDTSVWLGQPPPRRERTARKAVNRHVALGQATGPGVERLQDVGPAADRVGR